MSEHDEQVAFFRWLHFQHPSLLAFAVPNGGMRNPIVAAKLKQEGVKSGIPDVIIARQGADHPLLFIELKTKGGRLSESQKTIKAKLEEEGYRVDVCYGWIEAKEAVERYLKP